jgi:hypothetical protein
VQKVVFLVRLAVMHSGAMNSDVKIEFTSLVLVVGHLEQISPTPMVETK